jgi:dTMP kinase
VTRRRRNSRSLEAPENGNRSISPAAGTPAAQAAPAPGGTSAQTADREELGGALIVLEGSDGSGRSTQIALITEYLESQGFAVQTMGLRRSSLLARDIDQLIAENTVTRLTLALMYAADFYDQLENRIIPALRSGMVVLADRYIFTLIARGVVRGLRREYLQGIYEKALQPDLTFWLDVGPEVAFERLFKKSQAISFWEAGRDMSLSSDLYQSFIRYQNMVRKEFDALSRRHGFLRMDGELSVAKVNAELRKRIAGYLKIRSVRYHPSSALAHLWK